MDEKTKDAPLLVGAAEVEITPPVGTPMAGGLSPRISAGVEDPLYVKSIVLESAGRRLAYVVFDLVSLGRKEGDRGVALSSELTGIPAENIVWTATHTHTGPYVRESVDGQPALNRDWLERVPGMMAECVAAADRAKMPGRFCRLRSFQYNLGHNRRVSFKDGHAINTWNLARSREDVQSVGSSGPVDPEIGILSFDDARGNLLAVLFHFTLHAETNFGPRFSGDYPAVVAARIRERFGPGVITLFAPGACGDINTSLFPYPSHRRIGDALAVKIISALEARSPENNPLHLSSSKREVPVPRRDFGEGQEKRIADSGWPEELQKYFLLSLEALRKEGKKEDLTVLQAWRIGEVGFASLPGELFVEWGLKIKRESPFDWTYPVELGGDSLGYLVTEKAWNEGGYEPLGKTSYQGVAMMVENALQMLRRLKEENVKLK